MDVLGWFERRAVIGLILPEIRVSDLASTRERLDARVRRELANRLGAKAADKFLIKLHVYIEPKLTGEEGLWRVNPLLYSEQRSRWGGGKIYDTFMRVVDELGSLSVQW